MLFVLLLAMLAAPPARASHAVVMIGDRTWHLDAGMIERCEVFHESGLPGVTLRAADERGMRLDLDWSEDAPELARAEFKPNAAAPAWAADNAERTAALQLEQHGQSRAAFTVRLTLRNGPGTRKAPGRIDLFCD